MRGNWDLGRQQLVIHGAGTTQLAPAAAVLDEIEHHVVPVHLGQGRRLFERVAPELIALDRIRILEGEHGGAYPRYGVRR